MQSAERECRICLARRVQQTHSLSRSDGTDSPGKEQKEQGTQEQGAEARSRHCLKEQARLAGADTLPLGPVAQRPGDKSSKEQTLCFLAGHRHRLVGAYIVSEAARGPRRARGGDRTSRAIAIHRVCGSDGAESAHGEREALLEASERSAPGRNNTLPENAAGGGGAFQMARFHPLGHLSQRLR